MACDSAAFKAYDIRGIWPSQIDEAGAWAIGHAFVEHLGAERIAVAHDMRTMAPDISAAVIRGAVAAGAHVERVGLAPTEVLYHAVAQRQLDGGIMVTASHNPAEYIGMKCVRREARPVGLDSGLVHVRDLALALHAQDDVRGDELRAELDPDSVSDVADEVVASWHTLVSSFIDASKVRPLSVVLDAGNGLGIRSAMPVLERLGLTLHVYNETPDGTFPNHEPNPLLEENRRFIIDKVVEHDADLGIAWDGDADRCFFVDGTGAFVDGDFITALLAGWALDRSPGATILYDIRASRAVPDTVAAAGGAAIASRVGHAFIKERMRRENAVFAGEVSGHYYFADYHGVDTGIVPALIMLQLVSESGGSLADLVAPLRARYFISGEINSRVDDIPMKLQQLKERYADARISHVDGISIDYDDWHCNVRASNTEPLLRLNLESLVSEQHMRERRDEVLELLRSDSTARLR